MPLSFKLSPQEVSALRPAPPPVPKLPPPSPFQCTPALALPKTQPLLRSRFPSPPTTNRINLLAPLPTAGLVLKTCPEEKDGPDTWSVPERSGESRLWTLCCAVLCRRRREKPIAGEDVILAKRGHLETASALTHLWAALLFLGYAIGRATVVDLGTIRGLMLVLAGLVGSLTFFASTFYHISTPDDNWAKIGRQVDFVAIYIGVSVAFTADLALVTREFSNTPFVAIMDVPLAATCIALFFGYRRWSLPSETTIVSEFQCSRVGMYRRWHSDLDHTAVRQASTLAIALFSFCLTPALFRNVESAEVVLVLQAAGFLIVLAGMVNDSILVWPDTRVKKNSWAAWPNFGCVITAHSVWHVCATVAGICAVAAREVVFSEI